MRGKRDKFMEFSQGEMFRSGMVAAAETLGQTRGTPTDGTACAICANRVRLTQGGLQAVQRFGQGIETGRKAQAQRTPLLPPG